MVAVKWEGVAGYTTEGVAGYSTTACSSSLASSTQHSHVTPYRDQEAAETDVLPPLKCPFCVTCFFDDDALNRHLADAHGIIENRCYLCDVPFAGVLELFEHLTEQHSVENNMTCRLCGMTLKTKTKFVAHLSKHAQVKTFKCGYCGKAYYSRQHLARHNQSCFGIEDPFPCSHCDKCYRSQECLKEHTDAMHFGKRLVCSLCGKTFNWRNNYRTHMKLCKSDHVMC